METCLVRLRPRSDRDDGRASTALQDLETGLRGPSERIALDHLELIFRDVSAERVEASHHPSVRTVEKVPLVHRIDVVASDQLVDLVKQAQILVDRLLPDRRPENEP